MTAVTNQGIKPPLNQQMVQQTTSTLDTFKIFDLTGHAGVTSSPAGKLLLDEIKKSNIDHAKLLQQINNI